VPHPLHNVEADKEFRLGGAHPLHNVELAHVDGDVEGARDAGTAA